MRGRQPDQPEPMPDDALEPGEDFGKQKEQVDRWLEEEKRERQVREGERSKDA